MAKKKNKQKKKKKALNKKTPVKQGNNAKKTAKESKQKVEKKTGPKKREKKKEKKKSVEAVKPAQEDKKIQLNTKIKLSAEPKKVSHAIHKKYRKYSNGFLKPLYLALKILVGLLMFFALSLAGLFLVFGRDLPDVSQLKTMDFSETTVIYDREGNILYRIFNEENRKYVPLSQISKDAVNGTLAIEDKNFYHHPGFDALGIIRAQMKNIEQDDITQGASTITQQLAKNIFLSPERTYERKIKEFLLSLQIESMFSKDEILEMYLNKIAYGSNAYGIEAASKTFFGKSASDLTLAESAVLASLPKAPSYFSPYGQNKDELLGYCKSSEEIKIETEDPKESMEESIEAASAPPTDLGDETGEAIAPVAGTESTEVEAVDVQTPTIVCESPDDPNYVQGRKDFVLERMLEDKHITREQLLAAWRDSFDLEFKDPVHKIESPHFVFYVKEYLEQKYGKELIESGGLEVVTTLDPKLQSLAQETIADQIESNKVRLGAKNAAMVALDPRTGQLLAMVGSADYWDPEIDGQVNVATSPRQPGSSFKPLVYAAAVQNGGIGTGTLLSDTKTTFERNYVPRNSDNKYKGKMTVRYALAQSRNIPAIKAFYIAGEEEKLLDFMDKIGVTTLRKFKNEFNQIAEERGWTFHYGPAMAIGSGEVTLLELVGGYATMANGGKHMNVNPVLEIRDRDGNVLESFEAKGEQAMDPQAAYILTNILSDVYARPGGTWRNTLTIWGHTVAAKTGTSNKKVGKTNYPNNLLTIGYTPSIAVGFWAGNTDGSRLYYNAWGLTGAAPMWNKFMNAVLADKPDEVFPVPEGLIWKGTEIYPSFQQNTNYDKLFKSDEEEEEEDDVERDDAGVPVDTFVGERMEEKTLDELNNESGEDNGELPEDDLGEIYIPESDFTSGDSAGGSSEGSEVPPPADESDSDAESGGAEVEVPYGF